MAAYPLAFLAALGAKASYEDLTRKPEVMPVQKPEQDMTVAAQSMLKDDEGKRKQRLFAAVDTSNWLQPTLGRPGLLGM